MMQTILGFIQKELRQTLRDPRMRLLLFAAPILQMALFGVALSTETRNVRLMVASQAGDPVLDEIQQHALASGWFLDAGRINPDRAFEAIRSNKADVVLVPPAGGLSRSVGRDDGRLQVLIDGSLVTRAQGIDRYLRAIITKVGVNQIGNARPQAAGAAAPGGGLPLQFDQRILYNPSLSSSVYMVPGIMSVELCLITILLTSMSLTREKELGTFETIIAAPVSASEVILGKIIPYVGLGMATVPLILGVAVLVFAVPMRGAVLTLLGGSFVFICSTVVIGIFISTIAKTQQQAMMGGFIYLMPSVLLSGLIVPVSSMPVALQVLANINPITYYMSLLRNIMLKGGDPVLVGREILIMAVLTAIIGLVSIQRFKTTL